MGLVFMSCLVEFFADVIFELIGETFLSVVQSCIPSHLLTEKQYKRAEIIVTTATALLFISMFLGVLFYLIFKDNPIWKISSLCMIFIPLFLFIAFFTAAIIIKIKTK